MDLLNMSEHYSNVVLQHHWNTRKTVLCFFFFIPKKVTVALETFRNRTGSPDPSDRVVGNDAVFCQSRRGACVSAGPPGWCRAPSLF